MFFTYSKQFVLSSMIHVLIEASPSIMENDSKAKSKVCASRVRCKVNKSIRLLSFIYKLLNLSRVPYQEDKMLVFVFQPWGLYMVRQMCQNSSTSLLDFSTGMH
jgi:hypothetical protein